MPKKDVSAVFLSFGAAARLECMIVAVSKSIVILFPHQINLNIVVPLNVELTFS